MIDAQRALERFVNLKSTYSDRNTQIAKWRDMYFLRWRINADQELDHEYVVDNLPHEKVELGIDTLCSQDPIVEIPINESPPSERSTMSEEKRRERTRKLRANAEQMERFLTGYWERLQAEEQRHIWRLLVQDLMVTGYAVARVLWDDEADEQLLPVPIQHIKPEAFYPVRGRRGHLAQICAWKRPKHDVEEEWGVELTETTEKEDKSAIEVEFVDYWERVVNKKKVEIWHCCFADSKLLKKPMKTSYRDLPYIQVMAKPTDSDDLANEALPFIFGYKDLWEISNKHLSDFRDMLRYYADPGVVFRTAGGRKPPGFTNARGANIFLDRDADEDARFLQWEGTTPDFHRFGAELAAMSDRVGFNQILISGSPGETQTGWHYTQSTQSTQKIKLRPYRLAAEWLRQEINRHLLRRLEEHASEVGIVRVYGTDRADQRYVAELDAHKINGEYTNLIRINDHVPYDDIQKAQLIRTYREAVNGTPFLPDDFLRTTVAQIPYNEAIRQQIADQQLAFHEQMMQFQVEQAQAKQMIQLRAQQPTMAAAVEEVQRNKRPPPQMPPQMMGGPQNVPNMPPGIGLVQPGGMPMAPAAPPVAMGQTIGPGATPMPPPPIGPGMMRPLMRR